MLTEVRIYSEDHARRMERKLQEAGGDLSLLRKASQKKRWSNFRNNLQILTHKDIDFEIPRPNQGLLEIWHMSGAEERTTDFYATTGYWKCRETQEEGRGVMHLLKYIDKLERRGI